MTRVMVECRDRNVFRALRSLAAGEDDGPASAVAELSRFLAAHPSGQAGSKSAPAAAAEFARTFVARCSNNVVTPAVLRAALQGAAGAVFGGGQAAPGAKAGGARRPKGADSDSEARGAAAAVLLDPSPNAGSRCLPALQLAAALARSCPGVFRAAGNWASLVRLAAGLAEAQEGGAEVAAALEAALLAVSQAAAPLTKKNEG